MLCSFFIHPKMLLYYLVIDSWLIIRISQTTFFHPQLSVNRILVYVGMLIIIVKWVSTRKHFPKAIFSSMTVVTTLFLLYCFYSCFRYTGQFNFAILNNLIFYILALFLLEVNFKDTFYNLSNIALFCVILLTFSVLINNIINVDVGQRSFAGNRNHTAFYTLLGIAFLYPMRDTFKNKSIKKMIVNGTIFLATLSIGLSLGRMVTMILMLCLTFYLIRGYIKLRTVLIAGILLVAIATTQYQTLYSFADKLIRTPEAGSQKITQYNEDQMAAFTSGRSRAYKASWRLYMESPFWGIGYDKWASQIMKGHAGASLHSRWLQILVETGIPGFGMYFIIYLLSFFILLKAYFKFKKDNNEAIIFVDAVGVCMIGFFFMGLTGNHGFTDRLFYLMLALIATIDKNRFLSDLTRDIEINNLVKP